MQNYYIIYLRKSRQDDPDQTIEQVLSKHEDMLQEYAVREFGGKIPEENIYREVVSGESLDEREEIQKVLARIEDPNVKGVLVVEPQRLSRGDLEDCGRLTSALRYTRTQVVTPMMTYNLENKMERKFFQDELLRGRDYLEYTKEILLRGRIAAVKRGCFIGHAAPYGYRKTKIGKDHTLAIHEETAEIVRFIFNQYTKENLTPTMIARRLNEMQVPSAKGGIWKRESIRNILRNRHYAGFVVFNERKDTIVIEHGVKRTKRLLQNEEDVLIVKGLHEAIIDRETWDASQVLVDRHPRKQYERELMNPFSVVLKCGNCGYSMHLQYYKHAEDRVNCRQDPPCCKSCKFSEIEAAVILALEEAELPALKLKVKNDDGNALKIQQGVVAKLEAKLAEYVEQEETQFDLLENKTYSPDVFEKRHSALMVKMERCREELYQAKASMPKSVDYSAKVVELENCIDLLKDPNVSAAKKNVVLRALVDRIEYHGLPRYSEEAKKRGYNSFSLKVFLKF